MDADELGVGLVYWPGLEHLFQPDDLGLTSLEVEVEAFWLQDSGGGAGFRPDRRAFQRLAALPQRKVIHGIGAPFSATCPSDSRHLDAIAESVDLLDARWYSEHLAFNRGHFAGRTFSAGFLLPPLQTEAGAEAVADNVRAARRRLGLPVAVEAGVSYLRPLPWELDDGAFATRVCELADADLLLDLHNLWTNERNGRQSIQAFFRQIDPARVREIHLAGGLEYQGFWLDAHSGLVPEPVLALAEALVPRLPRLRAIHIEILPQFIPALDAGALRTQIQAVQRIWATRGRALTTAPVDQLHVAPITADVAQTGAPCTPQEWEDGLAALVAGLPVPEPAAPWLAQLARDPGVNLFSDLARTFRAGVVVEHLQMSSRYLMLMQGKDGFRRLLNAFWRAQTPEPFAATECRAFAAWLRGRAPDLEHLQTLLDYDLALIGIGEDDQTRLVRFNCEPMELLRALGSGRLPDRTQPGGYEIELTAEGA